MYLALKPGARCGWAAWSPGDARPACGSFDMPVADLGRAGCRTHAWLTELHKVHPFETLAYEQPTGASSATGDQILDAAMTIGIAAHIESFCCHQGIRCRRIGLGAWRRTFLGKGVGEAASKFDRWIGQRVTELGWWRIKRKEERAAAGLLDHLVILEGRHTPAWRERDLADLSAPIAAAGGAG